MAQILGSTPNHGPTRPPSCGSLPTGRFAADGHPADRWHLPGDLPVMTRGAATEVVTSADLSGAAFARSRFRARAVDRPSQRGYGRGRGCRVCWGQAPERCRSARPRAKARGRSVCRRQQAPRATGARDGRCPPCGAPASSVTHEPARTFAGKGLGTTGRALGASLSLLPRLLGGSGTG
jgi:hypothetical protein